MMRRLAILLAGCTAVASSAVPPSSRAEIDADAGAASGIAQCGAQYSASHDPSGLWSRLNSKTPPNIKIITTHVPADGTGTKTRDGDDGIQIFWDPNQNVTKDGITAGPCEVLYHELQHAADDADNISRSVLDDSCSANGTGKDGIPYAEWRAVGAENAYRKSLGLPPRMSYNQTPFGFDKYSSFDDCKKKTSRRRGPPKNRPTRSSAIRIWPPPTACSTTCSRSANSPRSPPATPPPLAFRFAPRRLANPRWPRWCPRWLRAAATNESPSSPKMAP